MGKQFKQPFSNPEERPSQAPPSPAITEQNTLPSPAVNQSSGSPIQSPQGYVQGKQGQYGPHVSGQLLSDAGMYNQFGNRSIYQTDKMSTDQELSAQAGAQMGHMSADQSFRGQAAHPSLGGQQGGMPVHPPFGIPQTPPGNSPSFTNGSGVTSGTRGIVAGGIYTPNPAWSGQRTATSGLPEKPSTVREKEKGREGKGKRGKKKRRVPIWARVVIGILLFFIALAGAGFTYYQVNYASVVNSVTGKPFTRLDGMTDPNGGKSGSVLNWGRINLLLLGSDTDEKLVWGGNSFLAQTVIVVSIDTSTHDVDMLSIPRDYYVNIPGYGLDKLDTAFAHGGSINNNMSGVGTVVATLDRDFGIQINFYAWVGLQGFIKVIDTVGGVDVNVMHPVVDDTYPDDVGTKGAAQSNYKRVYIPDGPQHLDGPTALEYVRSRHSTNDFDRSARQQQVLSALKFKLQNVGIISELPQIAKDLQGSVFTSLSATQVLDLGNFARGVDTNQIKHLTLGGTQYSTFGKVTVSGGIEDVVYPKCDAIIPAINAFLHIHTAACNITASSGQASPLLANATNSQNGNVSAQASVSSQAESEQIAGGAVTSFSDLFGMRDLLALMSMVALDSPQV